MLHFGFAELFFLILFNGFSFFEMQFVAVFAVVDFRVHIFGGVLRCTKSETVETERKFVSVSVFSAGVHFAEKKFPVIGFFFFVIVDRDSSSEVLNFDRSVFEIRNDYLIAVTFFEFVDRV